MHYSILVFSIAVLAYLFDFLCGTHLQHLLLNVDFLIDYTKRTPSFAEEFFYHAITTSIIYIVFLQFAKTKLYTLALIGFTVFSSTALYFILLAQAVRPIATTPMDVIGWLIIHVIFAMLLYRYTKPHSEKKLL